MRKNSILILLCLSLLLGGCGVRGGRYVSVTPHREQQQSNRTQASSAANSLELMRVLEEMIREGAESGLIYIPNYPAEHVTGGMDVAVDYAMATYPLGAYAVENIHYEVGTNSGVPAMAVTITYRHSDVEIRQIRQITRMEEAEPLVAAALANSEARLVMQAELYFETDFQQMARTYAETYPETVMEIPQVTMGVYGSGAERVVELSFVYQTGRDSLRQMQSQVGPVFEAAELYVSGNGSQQQKYSQLYAFLMERFDYQIETSITPAYSLLHHGVGDSRAFATVYAAMCRQAGLECLVVTGTRSGEPWVWNMVQIGNVFQHVDLLRCNEEGRFRGCSDRDMAGYVWDYSAYPECISTRPADVTGTPDADKAPAATVPDELIPEQTVPEETREQILPTEMPTIPAETAPKINS